LEKEKKMRKEPKTDQVNWNSTRGLQVICCIACRLYERQDRDDRAEHNQFHNELKHHFPEWRDYLPKWIDDTNMPIDDRIFQKARKMNEDGRQHPVHVNNAHTTGRYWDIICSHIDNPTEMTPKRGYMKKLIDTVPPSILHETPEQIDGLFGQIELFQSALDRLKAALNAALKAPAPATNGEV